MKKSILCCTFVFLTLSFVVGCSLNTTKVTCSLEENDGDVLSKQKVTGYFDGEEFESIKMDTTMVFDTEESAEQNLSFANITVSMLKQMGFDTEIERNGKEIHIEYGANAETIKKAGKEEGTSFIVDEEDYKGPEAFKKALEDDGYTCK